MLVYFDQLNLEFIVTKPSVRSRALQNAVSSYIAGHLKEKKHPIFNL